MVDGQWAMVNEERCDTFIMVARFQWMATSYVVAANPTQLNWFHSP
jgi:hypothetical protein